MTNQPQGHPQPAPAPHRQPWRPRSTTHRALTIPGRLLPALAAALALAVTSGAALTMSATGRPAGGDGWSPTDSAGRHARFVDKGGLALSSPQLYLIYWGGAWQVAPTPTADEVTDAVRTLMASPYLKGSPSTAAAGEAACAIHVVASSTQRTASPTTRSPNSSTPSSPPAPFPVPTPTTRLCMASSCRPESLPDP